MSVKGTPLRKRSYINSVVVWRRYWQQDQDFLNQSTPKKFAHDSQRYSTLKVHLEMTKKMLYFILRGPRLPFSPSPCASHCQKSLFVQAKKSGIRKGRCLVPKHEFSLILLIDYSLKRSICFLFGTFRMVACYIFTRICMIQEKHNLM